MLNQHANDDRRRVIELNGSDEERRERYTIRNQINFDQPLRE